MQLHKYFDPSVIIFGEFNDGGSLAKATRVANL